MYADEELNDEFWEALDHLVSDDGDPWEKFKLDCVLNIAAEESSEDPAKTETESDPGAQLAGDEADNESDDEA